MRHYVIHNTYNGTCTSSIQYVLVITIIIIIIIIIIISETGIVSP